MSGSPGTGSIKSTWWPSPRYVWCRASHCARATSTSTGTPTSIQGLIESSTAKKSGGVMAYRRVRAARMGLAGRAPCHAAAAGAATYESVIDQRYLRCRRQANDVSCLSWDGLLRYSREYGDLLSEETRSGHGPPG